MRSLILLVVPSGAWADSIMNKAIKKKETEVDKDMMKTKIRKNK